MDWKAYLDESNKAITAYRQAKPEAAKGFGSLHHGGMAEGALDTKQLELIALAIGISKQCLDCIGFHVKAAIRAGATREEISDTIGVAVVMGGGPAMMYGAKALQAYDQLSA